MILIKSRLQEADYREEKARTERPGLGQRPIALGGVLRGDSGSPLSFMVNSYELGSLPCKDRGDIFRPRNSSFWTPPFFQLFQISLHSLAPCPILLGVLLPSPMDFAQLSPCPG